QDSGKPWQSSTSGPVPCSAMLRRMPLLSMTRWLGPPMVEKILLQISFIASNSVEDNDGWCRRQGLAGDCQGPLAAPVDLELLADPAHELVERRHEAMHWQH